MTETEILAFVLHQFAGLTNDELKISAPYRKQKTYKKATFIKHIKVFASAWD